MYQPFLEEIASHGYLVITPGSPNTLSSKKSDKEWQKGSVMQTRSWAKLPATHELAAPFEIDTRKVALGGHACGGVETFKNLADLDAIGYATGVIINSFTDPYKLRQIGSPMLWIHGGHRDVQDDQEANFKFVALTKPELPVVQLGLQTGHKGSFSSKRGGIYAETVKKWLDYQLKGNLADRQWFLPMGWNASAASLRGWKDINVNGMK
jgi:hypothetical protein